VVVERFDLIVVGAGIVGAACAEAAAAAGLRVVVIERSIVGGATSAAAMGHLVALDGCAAELALAAASLRLWQRFADEPSCEFRRCGTLWLARSEAELHNLPARIAALAEAGIEAEQVSPKALYRLEPALAPGLAGGLRVPGDAVVYPPAVASHLLALACAAGAELRVGQNVRALDEVGVRLDDGRKLHGQVLIATGVALPQLLPELPLRARKGHLLITRREPPQIRHQLIEMGYADSVHSDGTAVAFNLQPRPTGQLLLGSSREYDSTDPAVSLAVLGAMLRRAFEFVPALRGLQALRVWTGLRPATPDGLPYLGPVPGRRGVWVAAGHEGLGVTTALASAQLMVTALLGRPAPIDPTPYLPARVLEAAA
jgi:glycine/D-amino acid oxidase-like deaminating enzyme